MSYEFKSVPVPIVTRTREPNPFTETVAKLNVGGEALSFVTPAVDKELAAIVRQLRAAGREANITVRVTTVEGKIGNKNATQVTFWAVPKQTRPRKDKSA